MMTEKNSFVLQLLESYSRRAQQIELLHYELEHMACITPDEVIDAMSFARGDGSGRAKGHISNKTFYIALNYQEKANQLNQAAADEIASRLMELEQEQNRLKYYVSLLDKRQKEAIQLFYFEGMPWGEVAQKLGIALRTVHKIRVEAIDQLTRMYEFTGAAK